MFLASHVQVSAGSRDGWRIHAYVHVCVSGCLVVRALVEACVCLSLEYGIFVTRGNRRQVLEAHQVVHNDWLGLGCASEPAPPPPPPPPPPPLLPPSLNLCMHCDSACSYLVNASGVGHIQRPRASSVVPCFQVGCSSSDDLLWRRLGSAARTCAGQS